MPTSLARQAGAASRRCIFVPKVFLVPLFLFHPSVTGSRSVVGKAVPGSRVQSPGGALGPTRCRAMLQGLHIWGEVFPQPSSTYSLHREGGGHGRGWRQAPTCLLYAGNLCARWEWKRDWQHWCERRCTLYSVGARTTVQKVTRGSSPVDEGKTSS